MRLDIQHALFPLHPARPLRLAGMHGARLRAAAGTCWVTVDGDPVDRVLAAGETWTVDTRQPLVISALGGVATLELQDATALAARPLPAGPGADPGRRLTPEHGPGFALP